MLSLNEAVEQLAMTNSVQWHDYVLLRWEDGHFLRIAMELEVEVQGNKGRSKRIWMMQVEMMVVMSMRDASRLQMWIVGVRLR